jgi:hypothetical protein
VRDLEEFQSDVARVFFSLPASHGYVLAGGGALLATGLSDRATEDLDFFGNRTTREISIVSRIFELAAIREGWQTRLVRRNEEFARLHVEGSDSTLIDICLDVAPTRTTTMTQHGPAFDGQELAGRKLLALFSRAKARDFVDVYVLTKKFGRDVVLQRAREIDLGVSPEPLCEAFGLLLGYSDSDLPIDQALVPDLREFFRVWTAELSA